MGKAIKLGRTMHGETVFVEIRIDQPRDGREVQYVDHTFAKPPVEVGIQFTVIGKGAPNLPLNETPDGWWRQSGQVPPEDRVIVTEKHPDLDFIEEVWDRYHLNTMRAGCEHMTEEMLARREGENTHDWQTRMLGECKCPVTGYTWGHAWLATHVPDEVIERLTQIVQGA